LAAFQFLDPIQSAGFLERGFEPVVRPLLHPGQHKHRTNAHKHPFFEWDPNPIERAKIVHASDHAINVIGVTFAKLYIKKTQALFISDRLRST
jgi:hypothetical protein